MPSEVAISFANLTSIRGVDGSLTRGIHPSVFTIYCLPEDGLDIPSGTLNISSGNGTVTLSGMATAAAFLRRPNDGKWPLWSLHVFDRRWRWRFSNVSGDWNRRTSDGLIDTATQKTPAELATLCFQALGEGAFDVSRMPQTVKPRALWKNQRADLALQALCDSVACDVVYNYQTDSFEIWPLGVGSSTPTNAGEMLPKYTHVPRTNVPASITAIGGPSRFQSKLKAAAIVRTYADQTETKVTANQLVTDSTVESPWSFPSLTDTNERAIAFEEYWRLFRIIGQQDGTTQPPNCATPVSSIDQYLLSDTLLEAETDLEGYQRNLPCYVDGDYWAYTDLNQNASSMRFTGRFSLDKERRTFTTAFPVFKIDGSGKFAEPALYLTTSYQILDNNNQIVAVSRQGNVGGAGGTLILRRPEIFASYSTSTTPGAQTNTEAQASAELDAYLALFQQKYANGLASEIEYAGILPLALDGNVAQVRWRAIVGRAPTTFASELEELDVGAVARKRRQLDSMIERLAEEVL